MRWARSSLGLMLCLAGCVQPAQERFRDYNEDGVSLFERGDYSAARDSFLAAQGLQPEDAALYYNLGQCCDHLGDAAQAERYYNECLQRTPNHADCRHAFDSLLVRTGRRDEAVR